MKIVNEGFDHIEFVVSDLAQNAQIWERMGFEKVGERTLPKRGLTSWLLGQGKARVLLTRLDGSDVSRQEKNHSFYETHGDGQSVIAVQVDDARVAFEETTSRGAKPALEPQVYESEVGTVIRSEIWTPSDLRYAFIERKHSGDLHQPALFDEGLKVDRLESPKPFRIQGIDHLTNNVGIGDTPKWFAFYKDVLQFKTTRHFDISTGRTGLISDVFEDPTGKIKVPINEATEPESQVQEFYDRFNGTGVQHVAFETDDILECVGGLAKADFKFLDVPHTYYEAVPGRVKGYTEDLDALESLKILVDGDDAGYLLQIFTDELVGPAFFEYIQRKGNDGFGEGNFQALFEAIERDQIRRGVLKN